MIAERTSRRATSFQVTVRRPFLSRIWGLDVPTLKRVNRPGNPFSMLLSFAGRLLTTLIVFGATTFASPDASAANYGRFCGGGGANNDFTRLKPKDQLDKICRAHDACCLVDGSNKSLGSRFVQCSAFCNDALKWNLKKFRQRNCRGANALNERCRASAIGAIYSRFGQRETGKSLMKAFARVRRPQGKLCTMAAMLAKNGFSRDRIEWPYGPVFSGNARAFLEKNCGATSGRPVR